MPRPDRPALVHRAAVAQTPAGIGFAGFEIEPIFGKSYRLARRESAEGCSSEQERIGPRILANIRLPVFVYLAPHRELHPIFKRLCKIWVKSNPTGIWASTC